MRIPSRASDVVCLGALLVFVAGMCLLPVTEMDLFFRLEVGREIWARGALLGENLFSFTAPHHPDLDASWAFEVALAGLYHLGGFPAIVIAKTTWLLGIFGAAYVFCRRQGCAAATSTAVLAAAAFVMSERFVERPHVVSFAGELIVLWAMASTPRSWSPLRFASFAAAMCLWANAHAGIFVAVGALALTAIGDWSRERAAAQRNLVLAGVAAAAAFATPLGFGIIRYWILHVRIPRIHPVDEFRAATWRSDPGFFVWIMALGVCVAATHSRRVFGPSKTGAGSDGLGSARRATPRGWLPAAGVVGLGWVSVRFSADAVLMTAPLLARTWPRPPEGSACAEGAGTILAAPRTAFATAVLVLAIAAGARVAGHTAGRPWVDIGVDRDLIPQDALDFVERVGAREHMYNDYEIGSYLAFEGYPRYRVFVDPRLPAYPEEMHRLLGRFDVSRADWNAAMERYGVDSALLTYAGINRRVAWWDPGEWALVYRHRDARVFVRRSPRFRDLIARSEIPATFSFTIENGTATIPLVDQPATSPVADCDWQLRLGDLLFELEEAKDEGKGEGRETRAEISYRRALQRRGCLSAANEARLGAWLGTKALARGNADVALARLSRALELDEEDGWARAARAEALQRLGRLGEAREDWRRVERATADPRLRAVATRRLANLDR